MSRLLALYFYHFGISPILQSKREGINGTGLLEFQQALRSLFEDSLSSGASEKEVWLIDLRSSLKC